MPKLVFINKNFEEQQYELMVEKTTVGRGSHNTLVICDPSVSLIHCEILMNGPEIIVRDLDSSNGTFIDGVRLNKQSQAKSGQIIRFGLVEARLELEPPKFDEHGTSITAVYDLGQYQAEQRREAKKLKPASIAGKVEPSAEASADAEGHTVLLPRPPQPSYNPAETDLSEAAPKKSKGLLLAIAGVLVVVVLILLWYLMKGR